MAKKIFPVMAILFQAFLPWSGLISSQEQKVKGDIRQEVVNASNRFGLALYHQVRGEKGNHFFSPLSLSFALSMALEGARGETAEEMVRVLCLPRRESERREGMARIRDLINQPGRKSELHLANAIWVQQDFPILQSYLEVIARSYQGRATNVDFVGRREEARKKINDWTAEKTAGKIRELIPPGFLNYLTRLVLTNAIYFRGLWLFPFDPTATQPEKFYLPDGQEADVPMMRFLGEKAKFSYAEDEQFQVLEMLYEGKDLSMVILLPRAKDLAPLEVNLSLEELDKWKSRLRERRVDVYLPRFKLETRYPLKDVLMAMGMVRAFSDRADFSGIDGRQDLFIQAVIHQAFVEVNEEGTEAAGATGVLIGLTAYIPEKPVIFRADHPFLFFIQEKSSGCILFMGRLTDPR